MIFNQGPDHAHDSAHTETFEAYEAHIYKAMSETDERHDLALLNHDGADCCCIDAKAKQKGKYRFAGGAVRVYIELGHDGFMEQLDKWAKKGAGRTLKAHLFCGYLLLVCKMKSTYEQKAILAEMQQAVEEWNSLHPNKKPFKVEIDWEHGTALPYMD